MNLFRSMATALLFSCVLAGIVQSLVRHTALEGGIKFVLFLYIISSTLQSAGKIDLTALQSALQTTQPPIIKAQPYAEKLYTDSIAAQAGVLLGKANIASNTSWEEGILWVTLYAPDSDGKAESILREIGVPYRIRVEENIS